MGWYCEREVTKEDWSAQTPWLTKICFHLDVTEYPICLHFFSWDIKFFTVSECFESQYLLALNIKSLHSWLFLCAFPWILFTSLIPHPHLPTNQTLSNGASFFSNAACRNMFLTEGEQEPSVSIFPLHPNNDIKAKLKCFVVPTHLTQLQPQQGGIPHPLMLTPPFEQHKTVKKIFSTAKDWCLRLVLVSFSWSLSLKLMLPFTAMALCSVFMTLILLVHSAWFLLYQCSSMHRSLLLSRLGWRACSVALVAAPEASEVSRSQPWQCSSITHSCRPTHHTLWETQRSCRVPMWWWRFRMSPERVWVRLPSILLYHGS